MAETSSKVFIDVDKVIDAYNEKNPDKKQLDREELAKLLGVGKQVFSDWRSSKKKTPKWAKILLTLLELGQIPATDFIEERDV